MFFNELVLNFSIKTAILERLGNGIGDFALRKSKKLSVKKDLLFERGTSEFQIF